MPTMTKKQYDAGLDAICERYERKGAFGSPRVTREMNAAIEKFKATATIVETAPSATAIAEAALAGVRAARKSRKAGRRRLRETMTAAGAPKPPPGTGQAPAQSAGRPVARAAAAAKTSDQMSDEELNVATRRIWGAQGRSPYWRLLAAETAPASGRVAESEASSGALQKPIQEMNNEEFEAYALAQRLAAHGGGQ